MGALISTVLTLVKPNRTPVLRTAFGLPLPPHVHRTISESEINKYRQVFVIGDVHGCPDELEMLLDEAKADKDDTLKIFAGDMINKGPDSPRTLFMLQDMPHFAVRGNNEESILRECRNLNRDPNYKLSDKYKWIQRLTTGDVEYLEKLPYTLLIPSLNCIVVHAGLVPGKPIWAQQPIDLVSMRNLVIGDYYGDGGIQAVSEVDVGQAWAPLWPGPQHVYFGHDARRCLQKYEFATGLDTGCVYGGYLTGIFINGDRKGETVSVQAKSSYKKSRNSIPTPTL